MSRKLLGIARKFLGMSCKTETEVDIPVHSAEVDMTSSDSYRCNLICRHIRWFVGKKCHQETYDMLYAHTEVVVKDLKMLRP